MTHLVVAEPPLTTIDSKTPTILGADDVSPSRALRAAHNHQLPSFGLVNTPSYG